STQSVDKMVSANAALALRAAACDVSSGLRRARKYEVSAKVMRPSLARRAGSDRGSPPCPPADLRQRQQTPRALRLASCPPAPAAGPTARLRAEPAATQQPSASATPQ